MGQFFKFFFASILASITLFLIVSLVIWIVVAVSVSSFNSDKVTVNDNSVLHLKLNKDIAERGDDDKFSEAFDSPFGGASSIGLIEIKAAIRKAAKDDHIKGIFLDLSFISGGFASLEEIRNTLIEFKKSEKFIYAYGEIYDEQAYYLASVADKIFLNPAGGMELNGLVSERMFFKGALEKLEVKAEIFRVGTYKSAIEPFMLDKMSDANRKQTESYLNSIYDFYLTNVAKSRNMTVEELTLISDSMLIRRPEDAVKYKLVTQLAYFDEVESIIREKLELDEDAKINFITLDKYKKVEDKETNLSDNKIAVIIASGTITGGQGSENDNIGSDKIASEIRKARLDKNVKAIVLRINSPGGSALASDVMWREVLLAKKVKPIIASMSDVAASGGYYMAMGCTKILAHPNTITGSIGIFGLLFNTEDFFKNKMGITTDRVSTGSYSDLGNPNRKFTDKERQIIQTMVAEGYDEFTTKAAEGRGMKVEDLRKIAEGRVWSGAEAKKIGLIDEFGGLDEAIILAAKEAELEDNDYRIRYLPKQEEFFEKLMKGFEASSPKNMLQKELGDLFPYYQLLKMIKHNDPIQARMPYYEVIK